MTKNMGTADAHRLLVSRVTSAGSAGTRLWSRLCWGGECRWTTPARNR